MATHAEALRELGIASAPDTAAAAAELRMAVREALQSLPRGDESCEALLRAAGLTLLQRTFSSSGRGAWDAVAFAAQPGRLEEAGLRPGVAHRVRAKISAALPTVPVPQVRRASEAVSPLLRKGRRESERRGSAFAGAGSWFGSSSKPKSTPPPAAEPARIGVVAAAAAAHHLDELARGGIQGLHPRLAVGLRLAVLDQEEGAAEEEEVEMAASQRAAQRQDFFSAEEARRGSLRLPSLLNQGRRDQGRMERGKQDQSPKRAEGGGRRGSARHSILSLSPTASPRWASPEATLPKGLAELCTLRDVLRKLWLDDIEVVPHGSGPASSFAGSAVQPLLDAVADSVSRQVPTSPMSPASPLSPAARPASPRGSTFGSPRGSPHGSPRQITFGSPRSPLLGLHSTVSSPHSSHLGSPRSSTVAGLATEQALAERRLAAGLAAEGARGPAAAAAGELRGAVRDNLDAAIAAPAGFQPPQPAIFMPDGAEAALQLALRQAGLEVHARLPAIDDADEPVLLDLPPERAATWFGGMGAPSQRAPAGGGWFGVSAAAAARDSPPHPPPPGGGWFGGSAAGAASGADGPPSSSWFGGSGALARHRSCRKLGRKSTMRGGRMTKEERRKMPDVIEWAAGLPEEWGGSFLYIYDNPFLEDDFYAVEPRVQFGLKTYPFIGDWDVRICGVLYDLSRVLDRVAGQLRIMHKQGRGAEPADDGEARCAQVLRTMCRLPTEEAVQGLAALFLYVYELVAPDGKPRERQMYSTLTEAMRLRCDPNCLKELLGQEARMQAKILEIFRPLVWRLDVVLPVMRGSARAALCFRAAGGVRVSKRYKAADALVWPGFAAASWHHQIPTAALRKAGGGTFVAVLGGSAVDGSVCSLIPSERSALYAPCTVMEVVAKLPESLLAMLMTNTDIVILAEREPGAAPSSVAELVDARLTAAREAIPVFEEFLHSFIEPRIARVPVAQGRIEASEVRRLYPAFDRWRVTAAPPPILLLAAGGMGKTTMTLAMMGNMLKEIHDSERKAGQKKPAQDPAQLCHWLSLPAVGRGILHENAVEECIFNQLSLESEAERQELRRRWLVVFCDAFDEIRCSEAATHKALGRLRSNRTAVMRQRAQLAAAQAQLSAAADTEGCRRWLQRIARLLASRADWISVRKVIAERKLDLPEGPPQAFGACRGLSGAESETAPLLAALGMPEALLARGEDDRYLDAVRDHRAAQVAALERALENPPPTCFLDLAGLTKTDGSGRRRWRHSCVMASCRPEWLRHHRMTPEDVIGETGEAWWIEPFGEEEIESYMRRVAAYHPTARVSQIRSRLELLRQQTVRPMREIGFGDRVEIVQRGTMQIRDTGVVVRAQLSTRSIPYYVVRTAQGTSKCPADTVRHVRTTLLQVPFLLCLAMNAVVPCSLADNMLDKVCKELNLSDGPGLWELYEASMQVHFARKLPSVAKTLRGWTIHHLLTFAMWTAVRLYLNGQKWHTTIAELREVLRQEYESFPPRVKEEDDDVRAPDLASVVWAAVGTLPLRADSYERGDAIASFRQKTLHEFLVARAMFDPYTTGTRTAARQQIFDRGLLRQPQIARFLHDRLLRDPSSASDKAGGVLGPLVRSLCAAAAEDAQALWRTVLCTAQHVWVKADEEAAENPWAVLSMVLRSRCMLLPAPSTMGGVDEEYLVPAADWPPGVPLPAECGCGARELLPHKDELARMAEQGDGALIRLAERHRIAGIHDWRAALSGGWVLPASEARQYLQSLLAHSERYKPHRWPVLRPGLERLALRSIGLGPDDAAALFSTYRHQGKLTELDLGCNTLGDAGAAALRPALRGCTPTALTLSANRITDAGALAVVAALGSPELLTSLDLSDNLVSAAVPVILETCTALRSLDIGRNRDEHSTVSAATASGGLSFGEWLRQEFNAAVLSKALASARSLTRLGLAAQDVSATELARLIRGVPLESALTSVDIRRTSVLGDGSAVAAVLLESHALELRRGRTLRVGLEGTWVSGECDGAAALLRQLFERATGAREASSRRLSEEALAVICSRAPELAFAAPSWCDWPDLARSTLLSRLLDNVDCHALIEAVLSGHTQQHGGGWRKRFFVWTHALAPLVDRLSRPKYKGATPSIVGDAGEGGLRVGELALLRRGVWESLLAASPRAALSTPDSALFGAAAFAAHLHSKAPAVVMAVLQAQQAHTREGREALSALAKAWEQSALGVPLPRQLQHMLDLRETDPPVLETCPGLCWAGSYRLAPDCDGSCAAVRDGDGAETAEELARGDESGQPEVRVQQRWGHVFYLGGAGPGSLHVRTVRAAHEGEPSRCCWQRMVSAGFPPVACPDHVCSPQLHRV